MKPNPIYITKRKLFFENEGEREGERDTEKKGIDEIPYTNLCCVFLLCFMSLSVPLFFVLISMSLLCVPLLSFSVSAFFFLFSRPPLFFFLCVTLSIYREIPKKLFPYFLSTDQLMEQFASVFLSTTPNFVFSRAHYSAFLSFYSFRPTLNSLISTGDISTFQLFGLTFLVF